LGDESKKSGAKFNIIDTGLAKAVGYKAQEAYRRLYAQKNQAKKKAASGFIPNFADFSNLNYTKSPEQIKSKRIKNAKKQNWKTAQGAVGKLFGAIDKAGPTVLLDGVISGAEIQGLNLDYIKTLIESNGAISQMLLGDKGSNFVVQAKKYGVTVQQSAMKKLTSFAAKSLNKVQGLAEGFIPNFSAVNDAIKREQSAGVPKSAIYLDSSPQLKSSRNPSGLMVANTIDEPKGGYQGIQRAKKEGKNPKMYGAAGGFVPNYVANRGDMQAPLLESFSANTNKVKEFQKSLDALFISFKDGAIKLREFTDGAKKIANMAGVTGSQAASFNKKTKEVAFSTSKMPLPPEFNFKESIRSASNSVGEGSSLAKSRLGKRLKLPQAELSELQKDLKNVKNGVSGFSEVLDKYEQKVAKAKGSTTLLAELINRAVNPKAAQINRQMGRMPLTPITAPQTPLSQTAVTRLSPQPVGVGAFLTKKRDLGIDGKGKETFGKFENGLAKAQFGLFALSSVSNTLLGSQKELNDGIQKAIIGISTISAISSLAPVLLTFINPVGIAFAAVATSAYLLAKAQSNLAKEESKERKTVLDENLKKTSFKGVEFEENKIFKDSSFAEEQNINNFSDLEKINKKEKLGVDIGSLEKLRKQAADARKESFAASFKVSEEGFALEKAKKDYEQAQVKRLKELESTGRVSPDTFKEVFEKEKKFNEAKLNSKKSVSLEEKSKTQGKADLLEKQYAEALKKAIQKTSSEKSFLNISKYIDSFGVTLLKSSRIIEEASKKLDEKISNLEIASKVQLDEKNPLSKFVGKRIELQQKRAEAEKNLGGFKQEFLGTNFSDALKEGLRNPKLLDLSRTAKPLPSGYKLPTFTGKKGIANLNENITSANTQFATQNFQREFQKESLIIPRLSPLPKGSQDVQEAAGVRPLSQQELFSKAKFDPEKLQASIQKAFNREGESGVKNVLSGAGIDVGAEKGEVLFTTLINKLDPLKKSITDVVQANENYRVSLEDTIKSLDEQIKNNIPNLFSSITKGFGGEKIEVSSFAQDLAKAIKEKDLSKQGAAFNALQPQAQKIQDQLGPEFFKNLVSSVAGPNASNILSKISGRAEASQFNTRGIVDNARSSLSSRGLFKASQAASELEKNPESTKAINELIKALKEGAVGAKGREKLAPVIASLEARKNTKFGDASETELQAEKKRAKEELAKVNNELAKLAIDFADSGLPEAVRALTTSMRKATEGTDAYNKFADELSNLTNKAVDQMSSASAKIDKLDDRVKSLEKLSPK
jgi:hypothetical protein